MMNIYDKVNIPTNLCIENQSLAIGLFDGIHLGHKKLIEEMTSSGSKSNILTFSSKLFKSNLGLLLTNEEKMNKFRNLGINKVFIIDFNDNIKNLSKEDFISFLDKNKLSNIYVGEDFTFGKNKEGKASDLKTLKNTKVNIVPLLKIDNKKISSTYIKDLLVNGNVELANKYLGYNYYLSSNVISGKARGRKLGFPTINQEVVSRKVLPHLGVYKSYTLVNGKRYLSMTNIGKVPTFNNEEISIETHVINEDIKLRVNYVTIELVSYIRDEKKFNNEKDLVKQLKIDKNNILSTL